MLTLTPAFLTLVGAVRHDGEAPARQAIEHHPQREDVVGDAAVDALEGLRRQEVRRTDDVAAHVVFAFRDRAEVEQHVASAVLAHDVVGLDVAMDQTGGVDGGQRLAQIDPDRSRFTRAEGALALEDVLERAPLNQRRPQPDRAVVTPRAVDGQHVGVTHARQRPGLVEELLVASGLGSIRSPQLQRHVTVDVRVVGLVHRAVGPGAQPGIDAERTPALESRRVQLVNRLRSGQVDHRLTRGFVRRPQPFHESQATDLVGQFRVGRQLLLPVDGRAVRDRLGDA